jgi:hypothetical protein
MPSEGFGLAPLVPGALGPTPRERSSGASTGVRTSFPRDRRVRTSLTKKAAVGQYPDRPTEPRRGWMPVGEAQDDRTEELTRPQSSTGRSGELRRLPGNDHFGGDVGSGHGDMPGLVRACARVAAEAVLLDLEDAELGLVERLAGTETRRRAQDVGRPAEGPPSVRAARCAELTMERSPIAFDTWNQVARLMKERSHRGKGMERIRVLVADDEETVLEVLAALIATDPSLALIGTEGRRGRYRGGTNGVPRRSAPRRSHARRRRAEGQT